MDRDVYEQLDRIEDGNIRIEEKIDILLEALGEEEEEEEEEDKEEYEQKTEEKEYKQ